MESILVSIKKLLGITEEYEAFDADIIIHINSAFFTLHQLIGVGENSTPYSISGDAETWSDMPYDINSLEAIKTYIYLKVRVVFDPPQGSVLDTYNRQIDELAWRLMCEVDK